MYGIKMELSAVDVKLEARFLRALKLVTEHHLAPDISRYCMTTWKGNTPWTLGETRDAFKGRLLIELLESIIDEHRIAPPFIGNQTLMIRTIEGLSNNTRVRPVDCRKLLSGEGVPKYVARSCEWIFTKMREEGLHVY